MRTRLNRPGALFAHILTLAAVTWPAQTLAQDARVEDGPVLPAISSRVAGSGLFWNPQRAKPAPAAGPLLTQNPVARSALRGQSGSQAGSQAPPPVPYWANNGRVSYGLQGAFGFQTPVPPKGEHIKLLYAQPQLELNLLRFNRGPVGRFDWLSEGLVGGAVSPAARIIGYSLLFRLEGRTRGNTKPILDFGAGVNDTTLDRHAYELTGDLQFTPQGGLGIEHFFSPQHAIVFEYRFLHMSNNGIKEPNHGFNAAVFSVGFRWLRRPRGPVWR